MMKLALEWMIVALFGVAWIFALRRVFSRSQVVDDERKIRQAFERDGGQVLRIGPRISPFAMSRDREVRTYVVLVKYRGGARLKRKVEFTGGQPTIVY